LIAAEVQRRNDVVRCAQVAKLDLLRHRG
jgi:hypothetical protein